MNNILKNWLAKQKIDLSKITSKVDCRLLNNNDINPITSIYGIYHETIDDKICIGDIIGFEDDGQTLFQGKGQDVYEELSILFADDKKDEYSSRSNSMLDYSRENLLIGLADSFREQPIVVKEVEPNKYSINGNGKHRFTLLKALYLSELADLDGDDIQQLEILREKYTIPVNINKLDYTQTYSNFFVTLFGFYDIDSTNIKPEPQSSSVVWKGQRYISYKERSLIELAKRIFKENRNIFNEQYKGAIDTSQIVDKKALKFMESQQMAKKIPQYYRTLSSFKKYINDNMKDFFLQLKSEERNEIYPDLDD